MKDHAFGFVSSWRALIGERGWYKPVAVLALLSMVPLVGSIALMGYACEWARLAAWGVDESPRHRGRSYGTIAASGGRAFLVYVALAVVLGIISHVLFGVGRAVFMPLDAHATSEWALYVHGAQSLRSLSAGSLVVAAVQIVAGGFAMVAMLRAVVYDSFGAGLRLDRVCQMIGRDAGGFMRLVAASAVGCIACVLYSWLVVWLVRTGVSTGIVVIGGEHVAGVPLYFASDAGLLLRYLFALEPFAALGAVLLSAVVAFGGALVAVAMQLVAVHVTGMWFRRFDVARWGLSSDPLPDDVPAHRS